MDIPAQIHPEFQQNHRYLYYLDLRSIYNSSKYAMLWFGVQGLGLCVLGSPLRPSGYAGQAGYKVRQLNENPTE
jgi:hypothetical protein